MSDNIVSQSDVAASRAGETRALVFGASGQIGHFLLPLLLAEGVKVEAISRHARASTEAVLWTQFDAFAAGDAQHRPDLVFSAGPLDGLLAWLARTRHRPQRIVAFSSTSALSKQHSDDAGESALADHLLRAEAALAAHCEARGVTGTILRPTLIYGCGKDANLSRIVSLARRWHWLPVPRHAKGLRQPVHAQDLAFGAWRAACATTRLAKCYEVCGGETLDYTEMVRRTVACLNPPAHVVRVPSGMFRAGAWALVRMGRLPGFGASMLRRMGEDLVFSDAAARSDFGWSARGFHPSVEDFPKP